MSEGRTTSGRRSRRWPWWASVLLAAVSYSILKYLLPQFQPAQPLLAGLIRAAPFFAPIVAIPLLLLAAKQLYDIDPGGSEGPSDNNDEE